jgi:molybdenum cofactor guanylyltransferase
LFADTTAFILAGGRSSRMGTDKAFLRLGDTTLLEHAIAIAKQVCETVALVGNREMLRPFGWVIDDKFPGQGPLAGIHASLTSRSSSELNLVLAVDSPAVTPGLLTYLFEAAAGDSALVTVPRANGFTQPLCAVYRRGFADVAERSLRAGRNKIDPLFSEVPAQIVEEEVLKALGFAPDIFDNVNTPEDWQRIQRRFGVTQE